MYANYLAITWELAKGIVLNKLMCQYVVNMEATYRIISAKQVNVQFVINMKSRGWRGVRGGRSYGVSQVTQKYISL